MTRWLFGTAITLVACAGSPPRATELPPTSGSSPTTPTASTTPTTPTSATPTVVAAPSAPFAKLTALLDTHDLTGLSVEIPYGECSSGDPRWIAAVRGTACVVDANVRCIATTAKTTEADLCHAAAAIETPAWATALGAYLRTNEAIEIEAVPRTAALVVTDKNRDKHVVARVGTQWLVSETIASPFESAVTVLRGFDASALAKKPALAVLVESRMGGSGMGTAVTDFVIMCADGGALHVCGSMLISRLDWAMEPEERRTHPGGATSLRGRPHVEVELEPTLRAPDQVRLTITRDVMRGDAGERFDAETLAAMTALRRSAGDYRLVDGELVRVQ